MNDLCNILDLGVDPEDLSPLPRPGKWDQPLNVAEIGLYCGQNQGKGENNTKTLIFS
jgi:hypothetical protein